MKNLNVNIFVMVLSALFLFSCGGLNKMKKKSGMISYSVTPEVLEMHADSVAVTISGKFPAKYFNKKAVVVATPVLKYANGEKAYKPVTVQGEKVQENNKVINYVDGGSFSYTDKIPYSDDMKISQLEIRIKGTIKKKSVDFDPAKVADGVIATPALLQLDAKAILGPDKFVRIIPESKDADLLFQIQQSNLQPKELKSEDIKLLKDYIKESQANVRKQFKGVSLSAYASPDGPLDLNTDLSQKRADVTKKYLGNEFKKIEPAKQEGFFTATTTPEDWDGFKQFMGESDIADKDVILRVVSMHSDPEVREKEIKNMAKTYVELAEKILPKLRRSKFSVNIDNVGYSDEEIMTIFNLKPDSLKLEEILYAGTLTTKNDEKLKIYKASSEIYPDCWRTNNNTGFCYINENNVTEAKNYFNKAKQIDNNNKIVINNMGAADLRSGDFTKAEEQFVSAQGAGQEVNYNMGIVKVKKADYAGAVTSFGNNCSFNAALAKVLNGDNDGAVKAVDCAENKDEAMMFYLKAIVGARTKNTDLLFNNLRSAIAKDASLSSKAKQDMEFGKYFQDDTFKQIVQ